MPTASGSQLEGNAKTIDDYAATAQARKKLASDPFCQKVDRAKAGRIIAEMICREDYPKKLLLGGGISDAGIQILQEEIAEIEK